MKSYRLFLALVLPLAVVLPGQAGIFGKRARPSPAQRVPELIAIVKTDNNDSKRESAAKELRDYDPAINPDIVAVLVDVAQHDSTAGVRTEAVQSLGKLRPISQVAGWAIEEALKDPSLRVRMQARSSLLGYRLSGYHGDAKAVEVPAPPAAKTGIPPVASTPTKSSTFTLNPLKWFSTPQESQTRPIVNSGETPPPPLAQPGPANGAGTPRPVVPTEASRLQKPPARSNNSGPDLPPG